MGINFAAWLLDRFHHVDYPTIHGKWRYDHQRELLGEQVKMPITKHGNKFI